MKVTEKVMLLAVLGVLSSATLAADKPVDFSDVDTNQDGRISKQEASSFAAVETMFEKADTDKNGSLDWNEFVQGEMPEKSETR